ncbi:unnamed protein product [marine sediment metagenome]|uniref:Uncharacterized protein n=1 Tax=marine sediment metagenome TaxID=412755 RepID=X1H709_9ZZZZ
MATDKYANQGYVRLVPALNALSFEELATFVSVFEKKAFLINRIEYFIDAGAIRELDEETDAVTYGLSTSDVFVDAALGVPQIFDFNQIIAVLQGAGVSSHLVTMPFIKDLSTMPSGGVLVPCRPIFLWMQSSGLAAAGNIAARIFFTVVDLKAEEYWELVEATRLVGA